MKRLTVALTAMLIAAVALVACRQIMPTNRYLQMRSKGGTSGTAEARRRFDHATHADLFEKEEIVCGDCHRFDMGIETGDERLGQQLSSQALHPSGGACHYCHGPESTKMASAPGACTTCHRNLTAIKPANHDLAWSKVHAAMARANPNECETCHKQADCINCHQRRDTIQTVVHDRSFRFFHGIVARANPMQCGSCHREDFCLRCHQQGKVNLK